MKQFKALFATTIDIVIHSFILIIVYFILNKSGSGDFFWLAYSVTPLIGHAIIVILSNMLNNKYYLSFGDIVLRSRIKYTVKALIYRLVMSFFSFCYIGSLVFKETENRHVMALIVSILFILSVINGYSFITFLSIHDIWGIKKNMIKNEKD